MLATPFVGLDIGTVEYDADIYKYMVGAAVGLKLKTKYLSMDFTLGIPLYAYDPIAEENTAFSFSVTYHY
jgi:hemolysin activation/secretion protein